jgi:hypothetical protein
MSSNPPFEDQPTLDSRVPSPGLTAFAVSSGIGEFYEVLGELGRGGMGIVYKARDLETNDLVAVKVLKPEIASDPAAVERFKSELRIARQITHPNVCRIHEFRRAGPTAFITMEMVDGNSLRTLLQRAGKLPWQYALQTMFALCDGLEAAHRRNIIHRVWASEADGRLAGVAGGGWTAANSSRINFNMEGLLLVLPGLFQTLDRKTTRVYAFRTGQGIRCPSVKNVLREDAS